MTIRTKLHPLGGGNIGSTPVGQVIFNSRTVGTYTVEIPNTQNYFIDIRGGGGGGAYASVGGVVISNAGGAGGRVYGVIRLTKGTYTVSVGGAGAYVQTFQLNGIAQGGSGGTSSISNIASAYGGGGARCGITFNGYYYVVAVNNAGASGSYYINEGITGLTGVVGGSGLGSQTTGYVYIETR
ncbi:MAG: hypothetical protein MJ211_10085 [Bacteroidales bacterium]|nr:hypothetical protein [Bacteroidales bacterium]